MMLKKGLTHLKMLSGDYLTYEVKSSQSGGSPHCRCCDSRVAENILHILIECDAYRETRTSIFGEIETLLQESNFQYEEIFQNKQHMTHFKLDPKSMKLPLRINSSSKILKDLIKLSRDYCFSINTKRTKLLKAKTNKAT